MNGGQRRKDISSLNSPRLPAGASPAQTERSAVLGYDYASKEKLALRVCNLCGSDGWTILTQRDRYGFPAQTTACSRCGLTVLNPRMTAAAYSHFYNGVYRPLVSAYHGRRIDAETVKLEQMAYASEMEGLLGAYLQGKGGARFLDVGGSTGVVVAHLASRFGLKATVLDPCVAEVAEAKALGIETITALLEEWQPGNDRFQVIGMFQTIDHLLDVAGALRKLRTVIAEDGIFIVDIVDFRAAYLKNGSVERAVKIDHPFSLTEETTEGFLARAGFVPSWKVYRADHLHILYVCYPCVPVPNALPSIESVDRFFWEVRCVENDACRAGDVP